MKFSLFNSTLPLSEKYNLIYNSYSDNFIILSKDSIIKYNDIQKIKSENKDLYDKLIQTECILGQNVNEIERVKKLQQKIDHNPAIYHLTINPTLACNFKCWYCYESHLPKSKINTETLIRIKKLILNITKQQSALKHFSLNFFGGEPFLHYPIVEDIIIYANMLCSKSNIFISTSFTTNGYLLNKQIINSLSKYDVKYMQITLDGNRELHNKVRFPSSRTGSYDNILNNVKLLIKKNIGVVLRINYTSENIQKISDILNDLSDIEKREKLDIQFHRVWQDSKGKDINKYLSECINSFIKEGFKAYRYPLNNVRSSCYADKVNGALINYNGDVFRCTAVNFTEHTRDGYLNADGKIEWENDAFTQRANIKFNNKSCLECRILPICNGGCSQKAIEYREKDYCIFNYDEKEKDRAIMDKLKFYINNTPGFTIIK